MAIFNKMLALLGLVERRIGGRGPARGLEAHYGIGAVQKKAPVRDISPTGVFIITREHFEPDADILLTFGRKKILGWHASPRVKLWTRVVRQDEDGVALTFVPDPSETGVWLEMMELTARLVAPGDTVGCLRIVKALLFLVRLSPSVREEIPTLTLSIPDERRREKLIAALLEIEERLEHWNQPLRNDMSPELVRLVMHTIPNTDDDLSHSCWLQLLATSCFTGSDDQENLHLADLLAKLPPVHLAIFSAACVRMLGGVQAVAADHYCSAEEMRKIAHTPNLNAIEQCLNHLHELGLLGKTARPFNGELIDRANMTPTALGLQLYARCCETAERVNLGASA